MGGTQTCGRRRGSEVVGHDNDCSGLLRSLCLCVDLVTGAVLCILMHACYDGVRWAR